MDSSANCLHVLAQQMIYSPRAVRGKKCFSLNCIFKRQDLIILIAYIDLISEGASTSLCKQSRLLELQGALNQTIQPMNLGVEDIDL